MFEKKKIRVIDAEENQLNVKKKWKIPIPFSLPSLDNTRYPLRKRLIFDSKILRKNSSKSLFPYISKLTP